MQNVIGSFVFLSCIYVNVHAAVTPKCSTADIGIRFGVPFCCSKFLICYSNRTILMQSCPEGLFFNENTQLCDFPSRVSCDNEPLPTIKQCSACDCEVCCSSSALSTPKPFNTTTPKSQFSPMPPVVANTTVISVDLTTECDCSESPSTSTSIARDSTPGNSSDSPSTSTPIPDNSTPGNSSDSPSTSTLLPGDSTPGTSSDSPSTSTPLPEDSTPSTSSDSSSTSTPIPDNSTPGNSSDSPLTSTPLPGGCTPDNSSNSPSTSTPLPGDSTPGTSSDSSLTSTTIAGDSTPSTSSDSPSTSTSLPGDSTPGTSSDSTLSSTPIAGDTTPVTSSDSPLTSTAGDSTPGNSSDSPLTSSPSSEIVTTTRSPPPDCPCCNQPNGIAIPVQGECQKFIICVNNQSTIMSCPNNLQFNNNTRQCDYPENANCPWVNNAPSGPHVGPSGLFCNYGGQCVGQPDGTYYRNANSTCCASYIICQCECEVPRKCNAPLMFNSALGVCDWPTNFGC